MKLYYSPGACSLAPHIVACEASASVDLQRVDLRSHQLASDKSDYYQINPKGQVPYLVGDDGFRLSEGAIIAQYLAESAKATSLLPPSGPARYQVLEWQNYVASEVHKGYSPLFNPAFDDATKTKMKAALRSKYEYVDRQLQGKTYLTGDNFTVADAYLFTVTRWAGSLRLDLGDLTELQRYMQAVAARPAVKAALAAEESKTA